MLKSNDMNFKIGTNFVNIEPVKENLKKVSKALNFEYENIVRPDYAHTNKVEKIEELDEDEKPSMTGKKFKKVDGLITNKEKIALMSTNADCNLILIYDPVKKIIGNVHAGWRGTFDKIAKNAIIKMKEEYNCNPEDIICCFCPSIRKCHFEVEDDVASECEKIFGRYENFKDIMQKRNGKKQ